MPRETVVEVGDGACTVLRCPCVGPACRCETAVLDCGAYKGSAAMATARLLNVLDGELPRVGTLIVSHFDADHWNGFERLATDLGTSAPGVPLRLVYPGLPVTPAGGGRRLPGTVLALVLSSRGSRVRELELERVLSSKGRPVQRQSLFAGDRFRVAARDFTVFWPPRRLDAGTAWLLERAIDRANEVADELAAAGYPTLRENLDAAYALDPFAAVGDDDSPDWADDSFSEFSDLDDMDRRRRIDEPDLHDRQPELDDLDEVRGWAGDGLRHADRPAHLDPEEVPDAVVPEEFQPQFDEALQLGRRASNDLSLIFGEDDGHFAAFGDARWTILRHAARAMHRQYQVVLAPHHGTFRVPRELPRAQMCVSQAGTGHAARWDRHVATHDQPRSCISTHMVGTVSAW